MNIETVLGNSTFFHLKEKKHRITFAKENFLMKEALLRFNKCQNRKPNNQLKREIKLCKDYWGCYPMHYYRYDLYRKDKIMTDEELIDYIPEFFFYELFLKNYDTNKYSILIEDKNITELYFKSLNIRCPSTILKTIKGKFYDDNMNNILEKDITQIFSKQNTNKIFVKPVDGMGGKGIFVFTRNADGIFLTKDNIILDACFVKKLKTRDYQVQAGIRQHPLISGIYGESVNTFRIATENRDGRVRILCATLRIGRNGSQVDNGSLGGLLIGINIETGETMNGAFTELGEEYQRHPDTNFEFKKFKIPGWNEIKEFTIESAEKLANFTYLGWDIALTEEGPLAIETNLNFGLDHYQVRFGGLRKLFNIEKPLDYWNKFSSKQTEVVENVIQGDC